MAAEAPLRCQSQEALRSGSVRAARSYGLLMGSSSTCLGRDRPLLILVKRGSFRYNQASDRHRTGLAQDTRVAGAKGLRHEDLRHR
jgi:hypothetical protein